MLVTHLGVVVSWWVGWHAFLSAISAESGPGQLLGYRLAHLAAIGGVVLQSWLGQKCPLTTLESWLRVQSGASGYEQKGFIEHWIQQLIFTRPRVGFYGGYTGFALLVIATCGGHPAGRNRNQRDA